MRIFTLLIFALSLTACSIYESEGRKFLEKQSYTFAGVSAKSTCTKDAGPSDRSKDQDQWQTTPTTNHEVQIFENANFELRVVPVDQTGAQAFSCLYSFETAQELLELTPDAVALTLAKYRQAE